MEFGFFIHKGTLPDLEILYLTGYFYSKGQERDKK